jgi:hypothetical protein
VSKLDRFRRLEGPRPDRKDAGSAAVLDRFRDPPQPGPDGDPGSETTGGERAARSCAECGANNSAISLKCFNCGADLSTPEMLEHQRGERRRAARRSEEERRRAEELAQREFERIRRETEARPEAGPIPVPGTTNLPPFGFESASPLLWMMRALGAIEDPWYRFGARLALVGVFVGLILYSVSAPGRYPLLILALLLLGGGGLRAGRYRRGRWDRWDRWR